MTLIIFTSSTLASSNTLRPFVTDGCTLFAEGTKEHPELWRHCCVEHDMRYWFGGDAADLDKTDLRLKACVQDVAGLTWAEIIYRGVRIGHSSPIKNKTHWSWGWIFERANIPLSKPENDYIISELRRLPMDQDVIEQFIDRNFKKTHVKI